MEGMITGRSKKAVWLVLILATCVTVLYFANGRLLWGVLRVAGSSKNSFRFARVFQIIPDQIAISDLFQVYMQHFGERNWSTISWSLEHRNKKMVISVAEQHIKHTSDSVERVKALYLIASIDLKAAKGLCSEADFMAAFERAMFVKPSWLSLLYEKGVIEIGAGLPPISEPELGRLAARMINQ